MYNIGSYGLGETNININAQFNPSERNSWFLKIMNKSGGQVANWFLGQDDCPIKSLEVELNKHICGSGTIEFAFLDFPIDCDDYVELYFMNKKIYSALIDMSLDPKGGKAALIPYSTRLKELLLSKNYVNQTAVQIFQDVISSITLDTGINYISFYIDVNGDTTLYNFDYTAYETPYKMIDELVKNLDDCEWGITPTRTFKVYTKNSVVTQTLFYGDDPAYTEVVNNIDYSKVKATELLVQKKTDSTEGTLTTLGMVGSGGLYPVLPIEKIVRKKIDKYTVSEYIASDTEAMEVSYNRLTADTLTQQSTDVKNFDISQLYDTENIINTCIKVQDRPEYVLRTLVNCDSLTADGTDMINIGKWYGVTIDTVNYLHGSGSVKFSSGIAKYDFSRTLRLYHPRSLSFMIYADAVCSIDFTMTHFSRPCGTGLCGIDTVTTQSQSFVIDTPGIWVNYKIPLTITGMKNITIALNGTATINIDRIQLYDIYRNIYAAPIIQANLKYNRDGFDVDIKLNDYDEKLNNRAFADEQKIKKLESIANVG
jgi:hypothetical protein